MERFVNKVTAGDCLEILPELPDGCVDMVLCDLPYGMTQNKWDVAIDLQELWVQYRRILKKNGVVVLTGQGLFTGKLIMSNPGWFKYKMVWIKSKASNFLNANKQPLRKHEDICVFYEGQPLYQPQMVAGVPYDKGIRKDNKSGTYGSYGPVRKKNENGKRYPSDVLCLEDGIPDWMYYKTAENEGAYHPTQKPVDLGRRLIRTYTNQTETVLDNCCGSGSFLVAAAMENRNFIGIEKNDMSYHFGEKVDYIAICNDRLKSVKENLEQGRLFY